MRGDERFAKESVDVDGCCEEGYENGKWEGNPNISTAKQLGKRRERNRLVASKHVASEK